jgi:hypothetical protein
MKVLIVAKTRMGQLACVGGLTRDNQNVRLLQLDGLSQPLHTDYEIGDLWDMKLLPCQETEPPHVEDVLVNRTACVYLGKVKNPKHLLMDRVKIWQGGVTSLYDGLVCFTENGSGYICRWAGLPRQSVGFWLADQALRRVDSEKKIRYQYPRKDGLALITYVGFAQPVEILPVGTLLRVSLARWWKPEGSEMEERCYLQLSGWYL